MYIIKQRRHPQSIFQNNHTTKLFMQTLLVLLCFFLLFYFAWLHAFMFILDWFFSIYEEAIFISFKNRVTKFFFVKENQVREKN